MTRYQCAMSGRQIGKSERMRAIREAMLDAGQTVLEVKRSGAMLWRRVKRGKRSLDVGTPLENGAKATFGSFDEAFRFRGL